MQFSDIIVNICTFLSVLFILCYAYQIAYIPISLFKKNKEQKSDTPTHKFAILIPARNEKKVISKLIESIKNQTYPSEFIKIFVVADNCTDKTADIARKSGAVVYERFNSEKIGKGYALEFLYDKIKSDYGEDVFDAYFVFDADNILDTMFIEEMNKTYSNGYKIVTGYRNSKNFGDNLISAGYGILFLRESKLLNHPRMIIGSSCSVAGTGFMFDSSIVKEAGGWKFFLLTEDVEFSIYNITNGIKIGYNKNACFYDEQPTKFSQSFSQVVRWSRGYYQVFGKLGKKMLKGIFSKNFFSCYDITMSIMPALIISILEIALFAIGITVGLVLGEDMSRILRCAITMAICGYSAMLLLSVVTTISEWGRIYCSPSKKILYIFTFPIFIMFFIPSAVVAMFKRKIDWKHTDHNSAKNLDDIVL